MYLLVHISKAPVGIYRSKSIAYAVEGVLIIFLAFGNDTALLINQFFKFEGLAGHEKSKQATGHR